MDFKFIYSSQLENHPHDFCFDMDRARCSQALLTEGERGQDSRFMKIRNEIMHTPLKQFMLTSEEYVCVIIFPP